ncbi:MAG: hypothetical protein PHQ18_04550 [Patescibacteria group bacterium]|nr:hypothetical protein [Patescibacteria group bacterium]
MLTVYYSPELISLLEDEVNKYEEAPEGWWNIKHVAKLVGKSRKWCFNMISQFLDANPDKDWQEEYSNKSGKLLTYYSPELIALLEKEANKYEEAPEGWLNMGQIPEVLGKSRRWCEKKIKFILEGNIDKNWQKEYLDKSTKVNFHYHSDLIKKLIELRDQEDT